MRGKMKFEDADIWIDARDLCREIYEISEHLPFKNDFKFKEQIRSSSASIMDNIAEGFERGGNKEFIQFLYIAKGSCGETRSQLHRAYDIKYINREKYKTLCEKCILISKKISGFIHYLNNSPLKGIKYKPTK